MASFSSWNLKIAARKLAEDLRLARQEAIISGEASRVYFFVYSKSYLVRLGEDSLYIELPKGVNYRGTTTFPGTPPQVHFNSLGRPSSGGTVILKSSRGDKLYVIMTPVTGRVRISKEPPESW